MTEDELDPLPNTLARANMRATEKLLAHVFHDVEIVTYGATPVNVSLECLTCGTVIETYDLEVR